MGQGIQRVWFDNGKKMGSILGFPFKLLWGKYPIGMAFHPKEVRMGCDHLMHAIEVGEEIV